MKKHPVASLKWASLAVIVLGVAYAAHYISASHWLKKEYAVLKDTGRPTTWSLMDSSHIPPTDNGAPLYDAAVQLLQSEPSIALAGYAATNAWDDERASVLGLTGLLWQLGNIASKTIEVPPYPAATAQLHELLRTPIVKEALTVLGKGTAKRGYARAMDYSRGSEAYFPTQLDKRRFQFGALAIILSAKARQQGDEGDPEGAWHTAITGLHFANALKDDFAYRLIQARLAISSIRAIAVKNAPSNQQFEEIINLLKGFEDRTPLVKQVDAERLWVEDRVWSQSFRQFQREQQIGQRESKLWIMLYELCPALGVTDHAAYLKIMRTLAVNAAESKSSNESVVLTQSLLKNTPRYCLKTRNLIPSDPAILKRINRVIPYMTILAAARVTEAGLAALRYRQEKGACPADLQTMNLSNLLDPFTGKPLIYRATASGFTIYSVGENGIDDGGAKSDEADRRLGLIIPGIRKIAYDDIKPDIVWSFNKGS